MHFKLIYGHHWNFGLAVEDTLVMLKYTLENLGHRADIERDFCPGYINIVQECFSDDNVKEIEACLSQGMQIIIIATEIITDGTFNNFWKDSNGDKPENSPYLDLKYWSGRYKNFLKIGKHALGVWHFFDGAVSSYKEALGHGRVWYLPHGYVPQLECVNHLPEKEKDIDFLFTGVISNYRQEILDRLRAEGFNVYNTHRLTPPFHRLDLLRRSKICLHMMHYPNWPYPSPTRYYYHMMNSSLLISEKTELECDIQKYIFTAEDDFVAECLRLHKQGNYTENAKLKLDQFSKEMKMTDFVSTLLGELVI